MAAFVYVCLLKCAADVQCVMSNDTYDQLLHELNWSGNITILYLDTVPPPPPSNVLSGTGNYVSYDNIIPLATECNDEGRGVGVGNVKFPFGNTIC